MLCGDCIADGERGFSVDGAAIDEDFVAEVTGKNAFGVGQVDCSYMTSFRDLFSGESATWLGQDLDPH